MEVVVVEEEAAAVGLEVDTVQQTEEVMVRIFFFIVCILINEHFTNDRVPIVWKNVWIFILRFQSLK